ncbi:hypothetical protein ACU18_18550 [Arthrobacter sp. ZBG10]|uniref:hypothetical protein n=1 Tax=Arthrobacter sp. ZBG10 TaxID=1676590 RepID=UPI000681F6D3|nr:hypothetical protein [Arthrobacter sp. ZBG10]KNH13395.1 hypothetical protein ACU18_18550 [Arthrobacter sp. ZBG10]
MSTPVQPSAADGLPGQRTTSDVQLPVDLRRVILAVPGVTEVFPSRPLWQRLPARAAALITSDEPQDQDLPLVEKRSDGGPTEVSVRIGVSAGKSGAPGLSGAPGTPGILGTPEVARAVAAAVRNHFSPEQVVARVSVVRIAGDSLTGG